MFEKIKRWYSLGLWTEKMIQTAVEKHLLTTEQMYIILERKGM